MKTCVTATLFVVLTFATSVFAQDTPPPAKAVKGHAFLKKFVGTWEMSSKGDSGQQEMQGKATTESKMLGDLWLVNSSENSLSGMKIQSLQMIGYDPQKKKYIGIWVDSMMNYMWHYEGTLDESGKKLTLEAKGPSMNGDGSMVNYRDAYEFKDDDNLIATSSVQGKDGEWTVFMNGTAVRKKATTK